MEGFESRRPYAHHVLYLGTYLPTTRARVIYDHRGFPIGIFFILFCSQRVSTVPAPSLSLQKTNKGGPKWQPISDRTIRQFCLTFIYPQTSNATTTLPLSFSRVINVLSCHVSLVPSISFVYIYIYISLSLSPEMVRDVRFILSRS